MNVGLDFTARPLPLARALSSSQHEASTPLIHPFAEHGSAV